MPRILHLQNADTSVGARLSPFHRRLVESTDSTDNIFNEDYSGSPLYGECTFLRQGILSSVSIGLGDNSHTQTNAYNNVIGIGTQTVSDTTGLLFTITDSANNVKQQLNLPALRSNGELTQFSGGNHTFMYYNFSATQGNNEYFANYTIILKRVFGGDIAFNTNDKLRMYLAGNYSAIGNFKVYIDGFYF